MTFCSILHAKGSRIALEGLQAVDMVSTLSPSGSGDFICFLLLNQFWLHEASEPEGQMVQKGITALSPSFHNWAQI